ncbi:MAG: zinc carboxypeptidase [Cyclobacteriaceae bacterium]|nr:zinc carboxypeptidase [Cyclobacteriaceae bacterium]
MKYCILILAFICLYSTDGFTQKSSGLKSPTDFLGYPLGSKFSYHHRVIDYLQHVENHSNNVKLHTYGTTVEGRELQVAYLSSPENLEKLESIRQSNLSLAGITKGSSSGIDVAIVWLSYNVHGNEASSTETAMKVLYELAANTNPQFAKWLENLVIIIDPCLNPDGRDRYVNWYRQVAGSKPNPNVQTTEHQENWRHGRSNHYLYDLNRDWVWQTQKESQQRLALYNAWLPQIHVDFHEQNYNAQYYFAPAARPWHESITDWQKEFQHLVGNNNAKYFDEKGWLYFTRETFDLLYPGYGDTYPSYNGAIGMTFEMPGNSEAGLLIRTEKGDSLTLAHRIDMHYTTTMATLEICYNHRKKLIDEFGSFFSKANQTSGSYLLKSNKKDRLEMLSNLLDKNGIVYHSPADAKAIKAFSYEKNAQTEANMTTDDLLVPLQQPKSTLAKVLFERYTSLTDSLTYDITAWSLPYAYGLDAYFINGNVASTSYKRPEYAAPKGDKMPYAFLLNWTSTIDAAFLAAALQQGFKINYATIGFNFNAVDYNAGSLIITKIDNEQNIKGFDQELITLAKAFQRELVPVYGGSGNGSIDLGSQKIKFLKKPKIALLAGKGISTLKFGEIWHFFDLEIQYPIDIVDVDIIDDVVLSEYNMLILPNGQYRYFESDEGFRKINAWVMQGGKLLLFESAIGAFVGEGKFNLKKEEDKEEETPTVLFPYQELERELVQNYIQGGIVKAKVDNTHPLAFGYEAHYYSLKKSNTAYTYLNDGWNVAYIESGDRVVAGYVGTKPKMELGKKLLFGVENRGQGEVVYFVDDPLFRGFWQNGKLFLANAVFFVE